MAMILALFASVAVRGRGQFEIVHAGNVMSEHVLGGPARVIAIEPK
jgi:hypothetical protein